MSRTRIVKGKITEVVGGDYNLYSAKSIVENSLQTISEKAEKGISYGEPEEAPTVETNPIIRDAFFAKKEGNDYKRIGWAGIEDEVYIVVKTTGLVGKTIDINLLDRDGTIANGEYSPIEALQDGSNKKVKFSTEVGKDNLAVFNLQMKPSDDEKEIDEWRDKINASNDHKVSICILVDAHSENPDKNIIYLGKNPEADKTSKKGDKTNIWLDQKGKWFVLRRKRPIIVLDPGHGTIEGNAGAQTPKFEYKVRNSSGEVKLDKNKNPITEQAWIKDIPEYVFEDIDKWIVKAVDKTYDPNLVEYKIVYQVSLRLNELLEKEDYLVYMTRDSEEKVKKGSASEALAFRVKYAKDKKTDYFISIHADGNINLHYGGASTLAQNDSLLNANRETDQKRLEASQQLGRDILKYYDIVKINGRSRQPDVTKYVLRDDINTVQRKTLVEIGHLSNPYDAHKLNNNLDEIAGQLAKGLKYNIENEFYADSK